MFTCMSDFIGLEPKYIAYMFHFIFSHFVSKIIFDSLFSANNK